MSIDNTIIKDTVLVDFRITDVSITGTDVVIYSIDYEAYFFGKWHYIDSISTVNQDEEEAIKELMERAQKKWNTNQFKKTVITKS